VYPHDEPGGWVDQQYRPDEHSDVYWQPTGRGADVDRRPGSGDTDGNGDTGEGG
jgi:replication-associated recombination protein RarA